MKWFHNKINLPYYDRKFIQLLGSFIDCNSFELLSKAATPFRLLLKFFCKITYTLGCIVQAISSSSHGTFSPQLFFSDVSCFYISPCHNQVLFLLSYRAHLNISYKLFNNIFILLFIYIEIILSFQ